MVSNRHFSSVHVILSFKYLTAGFYRLNRILAKYFGTTSGPFSYDVRRWVELSNFLKTYNFV